MNLETVHLTDIMYVAILQLKLKLFTNYDSEQCQMAVCVVPLFYFYSTLE